MNTPAFRTLLAAACAAALATAPVPADGRLRAHVAPPQIRHLPHNLAAYRTPSPRGTTPAGHLPHPAADAALLKSRHSPHTQSTWHHTS
ncbi:hypothetical protein [Nocardia sp. GTS18]|uniref:hypothetical protein n=1 Tax=Nocardia sp. GTS18 TaxID=1778064 RepID=UPI0015EF7B48|nr:hypothetical protein [Nocardia sp. GTS18]